MTTFLSKLCAGNILPAPSFGVLITFSLQGKPSMTRLPSHTFSLPLLAELIVSATCDWKRPWYICSLSLSRSSRPQDCCGVPEDPDVAALEGRGLKYL